MSVSHISYTKYGVGALVAIGMSVALWAGYSALINRNTSHAGAPVSFIFAHGLNGNHIQGIYYAGILNLPIKTFDFPDVDNPHNTDLAQNIDLGRLKEEYEATLAKLPPDEGIVLYGLSRGAASVLNFASTRPKRLKAVIAESPFDSIENIKELLVQGYQWMPVSREVADKIFSTMIFPNYRKDGIHPIDAIVNIDSDIPVLIICSQQDTVTPGCCAVNLYEKLARSRPGSTNTQLHSFATGKHARLIDTHRDEYIDLINTFLKKHNLHPREQRAIS